MFTDVNLFYAFISSNFFIRSNCLLKFLICPNEFTSIFTSLNTRWTINKLTEQDHIWNDKIFNCNRVNTVHAYMHWNIQFLKERCLYPRDYWDWLLILVYKQTVNNFNIQLPGLFITKVSIRRTQFSKWKFSSKYSLYLLFLILPSAFRGYLQWRFW